MPTSSYLPARFPDGTKYVVEGHGPLVRRHIEYPDGGRVELPPRKAERCTCADVSKTASRKTAGKTLARRGTRRAKKPVRKAA